MGEVGGWRVGGGGRRVAGDGDRKKKKRKKRGWHFHHGRQLARVFLIKRGGLHEWVTVISAEEDTYT